MAFTQLELSWAAGRAGNQTASHRRRKPRVAPPAGNTQATGELAEFEQLRQLDLRAQYFVDNARAESTRIAYERNVAAFSRWCAEQGLSSMPASVHTLSRYLTLLVESGRRLSTVKRARVAIGRAHADLGLTRPDRDARIRTLERGIGRVHGNREEGAAPLLLEHVQTIAKSLGSSARDDRDRALVLVGFWGALRSSELVALRVEDVTFEPEQLRIRVQRSKEDQLGRGAFVVIAATPEPELCAVRAVQQWLKRVGRTDGPLLRAVADNRISESALHPRAISRAIHRLAAGAAISGDYSSHSLRSGLATSAYARGVSERDIQEHGRWKDRRSLDRYIHLSAVAGRRNLVSSRTRCMASRSICALQPERRSRTTSHVTVPAVIPRLAGRAVRNRRPACPHAGDPGVRTVPIRLSASARDPHLMMVANRFSTHARFVLPPLLRNPRLRAERRLVRYGLMLAALCCVPQQVRADEAIIFLKNGVQIRGSVAESDSQTSVVIQDANGSSWTIPRAEIVSIAHPRTGQASGALRVESSAPGDVFIDDRRVGRTPLDVTELRPGFHLLRFEADAGGSVQYVVVVVASEILRVQLPTPTLATVSGYRKGLHWGIGGGPLYAFQVADGYDYSWAKQSRYDEHAAAFELHGVLNYGLTPTLDARLTCDGRPRQ